MPDAHARSCTAPDRADAADARAAAVTALAHAPKRRRMTLLTILGVGVMLCMVVGMILYWREKDGE